jgi:putative DNA primase/helicase
LVTCDRKHRAAWSGRLPTRFLIFSNELPRIADTSGALASRFILLTLQQSFLGREDLGLGDRLLAELPGVLLWALEGLERLQARGHFVQPASGRAAVEEMELLGSPTAAFVKDCCAVMPGFEVETSTLFTAWRTWCEQHGRDHPGNEQSFGRDLRAVVPGLSTAQPRRDGGRIRVYQGISLQ